MKSNTILLTTVILLVLIIFSCGCQRTDQQDTGSIKSIKAGILEWTAQNLDVSAFRNGDPIPEAGTDEQWKKLPWKAHRPGVTTIMIRPMVKNTENSITGML